MAKPAQQILMKITNITYARIPPKKQKCWEHSAFVERETKVNISGEPLFVGTKKMRKQVRFKLE